MQMIGVKYVHYATFFPDPTFQLLEQQGSPFKNSRFLLSDKALYSIGNPGLTIVNMWKNVTICGCGGS